MPIQITLIKEKHVVLQTYSDPINSADMQQLRQMMDDDIFALSTHKLHIIADFRSVWNLPGTILSNGSSMLVKAHPNTGNIICVTQNSFVQAMTRIMSALSPKYTFKMVTSLEEAYAEIDRLLTQDS